MAGVVAAEKEMPRGRTRWRRFGLAFVPALGLVVTTMVLMAMGVLALPVTIAGTQFTVNASSMTSHTPASGPAFIQYATVDFWNGKTPTDCVTSPSTSCTAVAVTDLPAGATLPNLDQVVCGPTGLPGAVANIKVEIKASSADATGGLVVDVTKLTGGTATFGNIKIGVPVTSDRSGASTFGQTADSLSITGDLSQTAVYTQAGTFTLSGLTLTASFAASC